MALSNPLQMFQKNKRENNHARYILLRFFIGNVKGIHNQIQNHSANILWNDIAPMPSSKLVFIVALKLLSFDEFAYVNEKINHLIILFC